jgi:hypothetical protein
MSGEMHIGPEVHQTTVSAAARFSAHIHHGIHFGNKNVNPSQVHAQAAWVLSMTLLKENWASRLDDLLEWVAKPVR